MNTVRVAKGCSIVCIINGYNGLFVLISSASHLEHALKYVDLVRDTVDNEINNLRKYHVTEQSP